jgi:hypothetical protein
LVIIIIIFKSDSFERNERTKRGKQKQKYAGAAMELPVLNKEFFFFLVLFILYIDGSLLAQYSVLPFLVWPLTPWGRPSKRSSRAEASAAYKERSGTGVERDQRNGRAARPAGSTHLGTILCRRRSGGLTPAQMTFNGQEILVSVSDAYCALFGFSKVWMRISLSLFEYFAGWIRGRKWR